MNPYVLYKQQTRRSCLREVLDPPLSPAATWHPSLPSLPSQNPVGVSQILVLEGNLPPPTEIHQIFDYWQLARMAAIGFFLWGPALHAWYGLMSRILPGTDMLSAFKKMALGQVSFGPAFTALFFSVNGFAVGRFSRPPLLARVGLRDMCRTVSPPPG